MSGIAFNKMSSNPFPGQLPGFEKGDPVYLINIIENRPEPISGQQEWMDTVVTISRIQDR